MSCKKRESVVLWHYGYRCSKIALVSLTRGGGVRNSPNLSYVIFEWSLIRIELNPNANKSCCQNLQHQELVSFKYGDWVSFFDYIWNMTSFNSIRMQKNLILFHKGKVCMSEWVIFFSCVCVCVWGREREGVRERDRLPRKCCMYTCEYVYEWFQIRSAVVSFRSCQK